MNIQAAIEAILMVAPDPVPASEIAEVLGIEQAQVASALTELASSYEDAGRGFQLREVGGGWRFYSHPRFADIVGQFVSSGSSARLSVPALETLAVIAYRQPCTRAQIAAIRGVEVDSVVRTLVTRGLVEVVGTTPGTGASLYATTALFLAKMGMNSLADLAPLAPYLPEDSELADVEKEIL